jgi:hypothetical protein
MSELTYNKLKEIISQLPPDDSDPVVGFKLNSTDIGRLERELETNPSLVKAVPSQFGFVDSISGYLLIPDLETPEGEIVKVRRSELPLLNRK